MHVYVYTYCVCESYLAGNLLKRFNTSLSVSLFKTGPEPGQREGARSNQMMRSQSGSKVWKPSVFEMR